MKVTAEHLVIVEVRLDGEVLGSCGEPFDPSSPDALGDLAEAVATVLDQVPPLLGVGVCVPGSVDDQAVGTCNAPTLGWQAMPVGERLRRRLKLPVLLENDVNALAVAERLYGRGRTHRDFLVLTIGRGVGAAIVADGRVYRGARGGAGEFGHFPVAVDGPLCGCGVYGCLEAVVGAAGLVAAARERGLDVMSVRRTGRPGLVRRGRPRGLRRGRRHPGPDDGRLINVVDPEVVVVLGEGTAHWPHWQEGFDKAVRRQLMPGRRDIEIEVESWDDTSWAQGRRRWCCATPFDTEGRPASRAAWCGPG